MYNRCMTSCYKWTTKVLSIGRHSSWALRVFNTSVKFSMTWKVETCYRRSQQSLRLLVHLLSSLLAHLSTGFKKGGQGILQYLQSSLRRHQRHRLLLIPSTGCPTNWKHASPSRLGQMITLRWPKHCGTGNADRSQPTKKWRCFVILIYVKKSTSTTSHRGYTFCPQKWILNQNMTLWGHSLKKRLFLANCSLEDSRPLAGARGRA